MRRRDDLAGARENMLGGDGSEPAIGELRIPNLGGEHHVAHDLNVVDGPYIGLVEPANVARLGRVARPVGLARCQREPAHLRPDRPGDVQPGACAAEKGDERRRVDRRRLKGPGHPAPALPDERPAPVMARRETPGRGVDPSPAPWCNPDPSAIGVRYPARRDVWVPHLVVTGRGVSTAIGVELHMARHVGRDMVRRGEAFLVVVARSGPFHKRVGDRRLECSGDRADPVQHRDIAGFATRAG